MGFSYTEDQKKVIELRKKDILVSAAAGSGKTAVLVARILGMIMDKENPTDIDRLLIVTFTKAAADEMRERISRAINEQLLKTPDDENLQKQATYIHKAHITTIDSFCKYLIDNHFEDVGIEPGMRVADEAETKLLMQDTMAELMEELHREQDEEFIQCLECFAAGKNETDFEKLILSLYEFAMSYPWPKEWLCDCIRTYECNSYEEYMQKPFMKGILEDVFIQLNEAKRLTDEAIAICEEPDGPYMYAELIQKEAEAIGGLLSKKSYSELSEAIGTVSFGRLPIKKDDSVNGDKREAVKEIRSLVKDMINNLKAEYFFVSAQKSYEDFVECLSHVKVLVNTTLLFMEKFAAGKAEKKIIDFHDMEHLALSILYEEQDGVRVPSGTALTYRDYFAEIMIDEYQDSNLVQELLLMSMAKCEDGERNSFMVGDVKQSIYKFRLARPEIFMEKYERFSKEGEQVRIDLHKNFRSRKEVIETVNEVFEQLMDASLGGITYNEDAKLYLGADFKENPSCKSELLIYEKKSEDGEETGLSGNEGEAEMIALRIQNLVGNMEVTDEESGQLRKAGYRDIVILLRSVSSFGPVLKKALEDKGIPVYIPVSTGYFSTVEIRQMLDYLKVLGNPYRDVPLCSLLLSPFFEYTDEEIAIIKSTKIPCEKETEEGDETGKKIAKRNRYLYEAMKDFVSRCEETGDTSSGQAGNEQLYTGDEVQCANKATLMQKVKNTLATLDENRKKTVYLSVYELLSSLMKQGKYMEYQTAMPAGEKRRANLLMLLQKAADFEKTSYHGLFDFVRYMEQLEKYEVDFGEAGMVDEHMDAVRIMTIHKSKGLEFPICFVSGLGRRYNMQSTTGPLLVDMDYGIAIDYLNANGRIKAPTLYKKYLSGKLRRESIGEELRILYVALTRAKEKLILTGNVSTMDNALKPYRGLRGGDVLPYSVRMGLGNNLACILAAFVNGGKLEEYCQCVGVQDLSKVTHLVHTKREYRKEELLTRIREEKGHKLYEELMEKFSYEYPHGALGRLYTKTSVSELKKAVMETEGTHVLFETDDRSKAYLPKFLRKEEEAGGTKRGSAYHKVLELMDYKKYLHIPEEDRLFHVKEDMKAFVENGLLSEEFYKLVYPDRIVRFLASNSAVRMGKADAEGNLFKERPFVMQIPAKLLGEEFPEEEGVLIQGIIDVYFKEKNGLIVLDYKTDRVSHADELLKRYHAQLESYANALEQLTGLKVSEKIIYSFALDEEISFA